MPEEEILERLLVECRKFQAKVERGEAKLGEKKVDILPPDPIGELGSGWEKVEKDRRCAAGGEVNWSRSHKGSPGICTGISHCI